MHAPAIDERALRARYRFSGLYCTDASYLYLHGELGGESLLFLHLFVPHLVIAARVRVTRLILSAIGDFFSNQIKNKQRRQTRKLWEFFFLHI